MRFVPTSFAPVAVATRSGLDESLYQGAGVVVGVDGDVVASVGDPDLVVYPRSALKPLQATAMVALGLDLPDDLLALVCASHDGAPMHLDGVRRLLDRFDLAESDLANTPSRPLADRARQDALAAGVRPSSLQQNCSGKHAGMLATCRVNGWPTGAYLEPDHPLQQQITSTIEGFGCVVHHVGVDGCGAPTHTLTLRQLALAFGAIARSGSAVARSMRRCPEFVGGPARDVTIWMAAVSGLVAKDGAAGVMALGLADGRAAVFKIADGSDVIRTVVAVEALRRLGIDVDGRYKTVACSVGVPTLGHGRPVGTVRALDWATWTS